MILSSNRIFKKEDPSEEAKKFFIVCEGEKREDQYFRYFQRIDSRVEVEVISQQGGGDTSPTGLLTKFRELTNYGPEGEAPKHIVTPVDEIWFVIDTDDWGDRIEELRTEVADQDNMYVAQSNPCFEVWLCFHVSAEKQTFPGDNIAENWKQRLPEILPGGFDSKKHPLFIRAAIDAARDNYEEENAKPFKGSTQVFGLAQRIYDLISAKIDSAYHKMTP